MIYPPDEFLDIVKERKLYDHMTYTVFVQQCKMNPDFLKKPDVFSGNETEPGYPCWYLVLDPLIHTQPGVFEYSGDQETKEEDHRFLTQKHLLATPVHLLVTKLSH